MTPFIEKALKERTLGLALHYPLIHAIVVGMNAKRTFEFGAGGSTRVFLDALGPNTDHFSISTDARRDIAAGYGIDVREARWQHARGNSMQINDAKVFPPTIGILDVVLHDGAHTANIVTGDIEWVWPQLRDYGLLLVHDTQHSYCGAEMREGLRHALKGQRFTSTTLPYGFGLTIIRKEGREVGDAQETKAGSPHRTVPQAFHFTDFTP